MAGATAQPKEGQWGRQGEADRDVTLEDRGKDGMAALEEEAHSRGWGRSPGAGE